jgi:competence protein ComEA
VQLSRRQIIAYVAVAAVVVAVGVRYVVLPKQAGPSEARGVVLAPVVASPSAAAQDASPAASPTPDVMVYVCGAVRTPGVVRLPAGARVTDALQLAGGPTGRAELAAVNLAAPVADGQQILVPERGAPVVASAPASSGSSGSALGVSSAGGTTPGALININTASLEELDALDGVGPSTAQKIIDYRTENGGFKTIEDIKEVSGIGDAKFAAMKDQITV